MIAIFNMTRLDFFWRRKDGVSLGGLKHIFKIEQLMQIKNWTNFRAVRIGLDAVAGADSAGHGKVETPPCQNAPAEMAFSALAALFRHVQGAFGPSAALTIENHGFVLGEFFGGFGEPGQGSVNRARNMAARPLIVFTHIDKHAGALSFAEEIAQFGGRESLDLVLRFEQPKHAEILGSRLKRGPYYPINIHSDI
jgi:hypothetical protein